MSTKPVKFLQSKWSCTTLGSGGFGSVVLFENKLNKEEKLAVKMPNNIKPVDRLKWLREVNRMKEINHPYIVSTVDPPDDLIQLILAKHFQSVDMTLEHLLFMEYCDGHDLAALLRQAENINGLPESDVRDLCFHIGDAITYLHQNNIIHRDIKPANILISFVCVNDITGRPSWKPIFKLADLGVARDLSSEQSLCHTFAGTRGYIAPEIYKIHQLRNEGNDKIKGYGKTVDFWSFGVIVYEACCGRLFRNGDVLQNREDSQNMSVDPSEEDYSCVSTTIFCDAPNQLSQGFQNCLLPWLSEMILEDPKLRENCFEENGSICFMRKLKKILEKRFLQLITPWGVLSFKCNMSTTIDNILSAVNKVFNHREDQLLIISANGRTLDNTVMKYFHPQDIKPCLHVIPYPWSALKHPKKPDAIPNLYKEHTSFNYEENRKIFSDVLHFLNTELTFLKLYHKSSLALEAYRMASIKSADFRPAHSSALQAVNKQVREHLLKAKCFIEYEESVQHLESKYEQLLMSPSLGNKIEQIDSIVFQYPDYCIRKEPLHNVNLKLTELEKMYKACLNEFEKFTRAEGSFSMIRVKDIAIRFYAESKNALKSIEFNIRLILNTLLDEKVKINFLTEALTAVDKVIADLKQQRLDRQRTLLKQATVNQHDK